MNTATAGSTLASMESPVRAMVTELEVWGEVMNPLVLTLEDLRSMDMREIRNIISLFWAAFGYKSRNNSKLRRDLSEYQHETEPCVGSNSHNYFQNLPGRDIKNLSTPQNGQTE